ncbi:portal protein [Sphingomonas phage Kharn]|uniref:Portal protein n=1 Tax=Sphingomonas phage Kharn TaxID=2686312 RepID=A0A6M3T8G6_9CAUD|nr:portal protein [Sphingomonas phage Kharn]QJD54504.1 portal protein [Sphingomonas phage Kharn]
MPVSSVRKELREKLKQYELIDDCLAGEQQVKYRQTKYLPMPNASDTTPENMARYQAYLTRAVFFNVAQRTQFGLRGQVFLRDPLVELPSLLEPMLADATGSGVTLQQLAQESVDKVLGFGRAGLYVDYPNMTTPDGQSRGVSRAEVESGDVKPMLKLVHPKDGINWRTIRRGAKTILSLVVFKETYDEEDDGFETKTGEQWRVLRLVNNEYVIEIYRDKMGTAPVERYIPKDASGAPFDEIPFVFIGSINNDPTIDPPPMYDLCAINMAHYRNSADYEDSVYQVGQPTFWFSGLTQKWLDDTMGGQIRLGAAGGIPLPVDGNAGILQAEPNTLAKEAMDQKEAQMLALGAKLVEASQVQRTATEADIDNVSETSVLSTVAKNVGAAFQHILGFAARFVGQDASAIAYELNTEFDLVNLSPEERKALIAEYQSGVLTWTEVRDSLRRAGIASLTDEEAKAETDKEEADRMAKAVAEAAAMADATGANNDPNAPPGA